MNSSMQEPALGLVYKNMQLDFLSWAANWVRNETEMELAPFDLPDVVNVLQALGYRIRDIGQHTNSPLRGGETGSRIVIMCSHSEQKCIMEQPSIKASCTCIKKSKEDPDKDAIWEITATTPKSTQGLVETGGGLIPPITREESSLMRHVMNYLLHAVRNKNTSSDDVFVTPNKPRVVRRSEPSNKNMTVFSPHRSSLGSIPAIKVSNDKIPSKLDSPARYRSLDTLTSKDADIILPEPGNLLPKDAVVDNANLTIQSSPNIVMDLTNMSSISSVSAVDEKSFTSKALNLIKGASESLIKAIVLIENNKIPSSPTSAFEEKILLASKNIKKLICTSKPAPSPSSSFKHSSSPNLLRTSMLSIPKPKLLTKSDSYSLTDTKIKAKTKRTASEKGTTKPEGTIKKIDKYSHIKSTIPKPSEAVKK